MIHSDPPSHDSEPFDKRTTNDVRREAEEALRLFAALQDDKPAEKHPASGVFELGMILRIEIQGSDVPLLLLPRRETFIGRVDPGSGDIPELDLSPYAAYQMGVSRRHALIRWEDNQMHVLDLGSRNGTYINGKKAQPHQSLKLHDGDEMRLGKMSLRLYFRRKAD
ncbi:MAG: FHA domain-containing protein [Anaerolineae bacterium]|nr:FHA domain-containing protein [Anaerolineae bacterium]